MLASREDARACPLQLVGEINGRAVDLMYNAFVEVESDGELMLDEDFIMGIFSPLYEELPEFNGYIEYFFEENESNVIGSCSREDRVLANGSCQVQDLLPNKNREPTDS